MKPADIRKWQNTLLDAPSRGHDLKLFAVPVVQMWAMMPPHGGTT